MKTPKIFFIAVLMTSSLMVVGQDHIPFIWFPNSFQSDFSFEKRYKKEYANNYNDIDGSPYLNNEFVNGIFYMKDSTAIKLPIRYNIYSDQMEYEVDGVNYTVGSPENISRVEFGESKFVYLSFIGKGGFFELIEWGKCALVQKMRVDFIRSEGAKPIIGMTKARFEKHLDVFFLVINQNQPFRIENMNSVMKALQNQKSKVETFINQEKIKNTKKENLIKIAKYYNSL